LTFFAFYSIIRFLIKIILCDRDQPPHGAPDLKGRERSDSADRDDDSTKERRDGEWGSGLIVRTQTVALLPDLGSTTSSSAHSLRHQRARHPRDAAGDRVTRGGDDGDDAELPKDRAWRSRVKPLATDDRRRTSVQRADSDLRSRMVRNPSFARSRYVLTNTGAWTRVAPPGSPGGGRARDLQRKRTRDGLARQRSAERDACPPGLFLIRYLNPCAADLLAGDMRLVRILTTTKPAFVLTARTRTTAHALAHSRTRALTHTHDVCCRWTDGG
jgi:hypothetical protein